MFAYCNNNPIIFVDPDGYASQSVFGFVSKIKSLMNMLVNVIQNITGIINDKNSKKNPYKLQNGSKATITTKDFWFSIELRGVVDILLQGDSYFNYEIYVKGPSGTRLSSSGYTYTTYTSEYRIDNNTYLVHVTSSSKIKISCTISMHIDRYVNSRGGVWQPYHDYGTPDHNIVYLYKIYVPPEYVAELERFVDCDDYINMVDDIINHTLTVAQAIVFYHVPISKKLSTAVTVIIGISLNCFGGTMFRDKVVNDIRKASNYNPLTNKSSNGVVMSVYMQDSLVIYNVREWDGQIILGEFGYIGYLEEF